MNFTMIGPVYPYRGGIAHYTAQLIQALSKAGHDVQTVSFRRQYPDWLYPGTTDKDPSLEMLQLDAQYLLDPMNPFTWWLATDQIYKHRPDLVVIQWWTTFWAPAFACLSAELRRKKLKVGFIIHNVLPHEQRFFDPWLARMALSQGQVFLAQTEREKQRLLQLLPGRQVRVCQLPTYTFLTNRQLPKEEARRKMGFPLNRPLILFFGIVRPYKGLKYLLDSMAILKGKNPVDLPFLLVAGEIWEEKEIYQEQIKRLDLNECVRLDDRYVPDEEAAVMFSAADMLVAPYVDGTQSAAAGLALGFGLPLVVTDIVAGGISEENQQYVRVVKASDAEVIAQAIQQVISEPRPLQFRYHNVEDEWKRLIISLEEFA
jgi:glycosyltransferase involved in cell wall biosynthesis